MSSEGWEVQGAAPPTKEATEAELTALMKKKAHQWVLIEPGKYPDAPEIPLDEYARL